MLGGFIFHKNKTNQMSEQLMYFQIFMGMTSHNQYSMLQHILSQWNNGQL